jgi:hypothetical protein
VHRAGFPRHWKEEFANLQQGLERLASEKENARTSSAALPARTQTADTQPPSVKVEPVKSARAGQDFRVAVRVTDPSGVKSVRLRYRHLTQYEDYHSTDMTLDSASGSYVARVPGEFIVPKWNLMYFVEAIDKNGNGRNYPDLEVESPYVVVPVER